jgi:hypothetical protein
VSDRWLLIRGDEVSFLTVPDRNGRVEEIIVSQDLCLCEDKKNAFGRSCDIWIIPPLPMEGDESAPDWAVSEMDAYLGPSTTLQSCSFEKPHGPWRKVARLSGVRYRRSRNEGHYEHPFDNPVTLSESLSCEAWKMSLPNGCIVNHRGFVRP